MDHNDDIKGFLDQEVAVSVRWLANTLAVNVNEAASLMNKYHEKNKSTLQAHYLISGVRKSNGKVSFLVTSEDKMNDVVDTFSSHAKQIFSIAHIKSDNVLMYAVQCDYDQARDCMLCKSPCSTGFISNSVGTVKYPSARFSDQGSRIAATYPSASTNQPSSSIELSKQQQVSLNDTKPTVKTNINLKAASAANNFFKNKGSVTKKDIPPSKAQEKTGSGIATLVDDEEAEWGDAPTSRNPLISHAMPMRTNVQQASPAQLAQEHASSSSVGMMGENNIGKPADPVKVSSSPSVKRQKHVHGAMDDFMEDVAVSKYIIASTAAASAENSGKLPTKKTKRKLIEKMFADEKGYLVTEMVYEEVTDDDNVPSSTSAAPEKPQPAPSSSTANPRTSSTASKKSSTAAGQKKNMMSFFGKK